MMVCVFEYKGKQYTQDELVGALKNAPLNEMADFVPGINKVPDAPFKKTWDELALKKAITHAVKNGYDSISWTPGEAQAARYDLSKSIQKLQYNPETKELWVTEQGRANAPRVMGKYDEAKLADAIGKEAAEKLVKAETRNGLHVLEDQDLKVGGQGMKAFYDKMLVDKMNALTKKHGGKVEKGGVPDGYQAIDKNGEVVAGFKDKTSADKWVKQMGNNYKVKEATNPVHVLKITPELREHVLKKGFPLFSAGVPVFSPVDHDPFKKDK